MSAQTAPAGPAPRDNDSSRDTLLLYCPYDRKVTRHTRRGPDNVIVCVECGRRLEVTHTQRTGQIVPLARPMAAAYSGSRVVRRTPAGRRRVATPWLGFVMVAVLTAGALFALMTTFGIMANPFASPAQRSAIAASDSVSVPVQDSVAGTAESSGSPAAAPSQAGMLLRIANTDRIGAYLRRTPDLNDKANRAWADGTALKVIGPDTIENGINWKHVQDPAGNEGWIPAQYTTPAS